MAVVALALLKSVGAHRKSENDNYGHEAVRYYAAKHRIVKVCQHVFKFHFIPGLTFAIILHQRSLIV